MGNLCEHRGWLPPEEYKRAKETLALPCADLMALGGTPKSAKILLIRRAESIYMNPGEIDRGVGSWCLPGGRVLIGDRVHDVLAREAEHVGLSGFSYISPFGPTWPVYHSGEPDQIEDRHVTTNVYPVWAHGDELKLIGPEHSDAAWFSLPELEGMGFAYAHREKVSVAVSRLAEFSSISF